MPPGNSIDAPRCLCYVPRHQESVKAGPWSALWVRCPYRRASLESWQKAPKYAMEPKKSYAEILCLVRDFTRIVLETETESCVSEGRDVLGRLCLEIGRAPVNKVVSFKQRCVSVLLLLVLRCLLCLNPLKLSHQLGQASTLTVLCSIEKKKTHKLHVIISIMTCNWRGIYLELYRNA